MPVARPETSDSRVIAHVDMDCFYVQVEQRKLPNLRGQPTAVVQYNSWKGGGLIAVSYEARKYGVKRSMRGDEAKQVCPQIQLVRVPVARGKADLTIYRNAGSEVVAILARKGRCERASIDEVYLDLTDASEKMFSETPPESLEAIDEEVIKSHILGLSMEGSNVREAVKDWICRSNADHRDKLLACGAFIVAELRLQVLKETQFSCSAGIAHNKMLAKLASGMNKPAQQTVVPLSSVRGLLEPLPIKKMKQLGGKLGSSLQTDLGVNTVGDLLQFSEERLQDRYGINTGTWLWNIARGINGDEVEGRLLPKSHGSGKLFPGLRSLKTITTVEFWLNKFSEELSERLQYDMEQNKRIAHTLTLHATAYKSNDSDSQKKFPSKSCPLRYGAAKIQEDALSLFQAGLREYLESYSKTQGNRCSRWGINSLTLSASKIVDIPSGTCSIMKYFRSRDQFDPSSKELNDKVLHEAAPLSPSGPHPPEPQIEYYEEEKSMNYVMPSHLEDERKMCEDKETCILMRSICDQNPSCSSSKHAQDDVSGETSPLSAAGSKSCLVVKKVEPQLESIEEETRIKNNVDGIRSREQKRNALKEKGTCSIMKYFWSRDQFDPSSKELDEKVIRETAPLSLSGSESFSGPHPPEPQIEYYEEEKSTNYVMPSHLEDERKMCEDKETCILMKSTCDQNPSGSSSKHAHDDFCGETSPLSTAGAKNCLVVKKAEPQLESIDEETRIKSNVDDIRPREQKRNALKEKGTSSILRFFQSQNCSPSTQEPRQELVNAIQVTKVSLLSGEVSHDTMLVESSTFRGAHNVSRNEERMNAWNYKIDEIDPTVVDELPMEIQEEVRAWLRPHKRANTVKRGSSIAHYFLPNKNP